MLAVGIDISKSKSVAAILNQDGSMHTSPFEFHHFSKYLNSYFSRLFNFPPSIDVFVLYLLNKICGFLSKKTFPPHARQANSTQLSWDACISICDEFHTLLEFLLRIKEFYIAHRIINPTCNV